MYKPKKLSIILPSYNEGENLTILLPQIIRELDLLSVEYEVIVVDQICSTDNTPDVCKKYGVQYVNRIGSNTYGSAVRTGISCSSGELVVFMDSDGSHSPSFIKELYAHSHDADVVVASRYVEHGKTDNPTSLVLMSKILNVTYSIVLGIPCKDISNSFKLYNGALLRNHSYVCDNFDIVEEILYKIYKANPGLRIIEIPFFFQKRMHGVTKRNLLAFICTYLYTMLKLKSMK